MVRLSTRYSNSNTNGQDKNKPCWVVHRVVLICHLHVCNSQQLSQTPAKYRRYGTSALHGLLGLEKGDRKKGNRQMENKSHFLSSQMLKMEINKSTHNYRSDIIYA